MPVKYGTETPVAIYYGDIAAGGYDVQRVYYGETLLWEKEPETLAFLTKAAAFDDNRVQCSGLAMSDSAGITIIMGVETPAAWTPGVDQFLLEMVGNHMEARFRQVDRTLVFRLKDNAATPNYICSLRSSMVFAPATRYFIGISWGAGLGGQIMVDGAIATLETNTDLGGVAELSAGNIAIGGRFGLDVGALQGRIGPLWIIPQRLNLITEMSKFWDGMNFIDTIQGADIRMPWDDVAPPPFVSDGTQAVSFSVFGTDPTVTVENWTAAGDYLDQAVNLGANRLVTTTNPATPDGAEFTIFMAVETPSSWGVNNQYILDTGSGRIVVFFRNTDRRLVVRGQTSVGATVFNMVSGTVFSASNTKYLIMASYDAANGNEMRVNDVAETLFTNENNGGTIDFTNGNWSLGGRVFDATQNLNGRIGPLWIKNARDDTATAWPSYHDGTGFVDAQNGAAIRMAWTNLVSDGTQAVTYAGDPGSVTLENW